MPDEITTRILYAAAVDDFDAIATAAIELDLDAPLARPVRAIVDRALGGRAMAVAA